MRKIGHKIAKPDFEGFSRPFHGVFTGFSWPFHGVTIFVNLEVAEYFFQALDIFRGETLLG